MLTKQTEEQSEKQRERVALRREKKNAQNANIIANSIQINTDAGCFVKESNGKPKHSYCEQCALERKCEAYKIHMDVHHLFSLSACSKGDKGRVDRIFSEYI